MNVIKKINNAKSIWEVLPDLTTEELESAIKLSADSYYNDSVSLISDEIYDILVDRLKEIHPKSNIFKQTGAPIKKGKKVKLPYWMGSMDKVKTDEEINAWSEKFEGPYVISDKLDGISCLLTKDKSGKFKLHTRGDGAMGQDITHLLNSVDSSHSDLLNAKQEIALRGELVMSKDNFAKYEEQMANARNLVGGVVNSKPESVNVEYAADIDLVCYEIIEPKLKPSDQMKQLKKWGLNVVHYDIYEDISFDILDSVLKRRKNKSPYQIDGIIITDNKVHSRNQSGNPNYSIAYKGLSQVLQTTVIDVFWKPSKDGILVPTVHFKKVRLAGADIRVATGFNARFIVDNKIGPGAVISIVRSGDTIPYIKSVVTGTKKLSLPEEEYEWDENEVNFVLKHPEENQTVVTQRLVKFLKDIGVENMSEGIVIKLVNAGYNDIPKIISLTKKKLMKLGGFQETLATKLINGLNDKLNELDTLKLMVASNVLGRGFGEKKIKRILNVYPDIVKLYNKANKKEWSDKLLEIEGFDTITVDKFLAALPDYQLFHKNISKIVNIKTYKSVVKKSGLFKDQTVVFTGFRNDQWVQFIEAEGGKVSGSVSKNTTLLVYNDGEESSTKYKKAQQLGVKLITRSNFEKKYFH